MLKYCIGTVVELEWGAGGGTSSVEPSISYYAIIITLVVGE